MEKMKAKKSVTFLISLMRAVDMSCSVPGQDWQKITKEYLFDPDDWDLLEPDAKLVDKFGDMLSGHFASSGMTPGKYYG